MKEKDVKKLYVELGKVAIKDRRKKFKDFFINALCFLGFAFPGFLLLWASSKFISLAVNQSLDWGIILVSIILLVGGLIYLLLAFLIWAVIDIHILLKKYLEGENGEIN